MNLKDKLKKYRKQQKMTQKELAERCDLAVITIKQYEAGKYQPNAKNLVKLASALHVDVNDLLSSVDQLLFIANDFAEEMDFKREIQNDIWKYASDNPGINRDGVVGKLIFKNDFQMLIVGLLNGLLREGMTSLKFYYTSKNIRLLASNNFSQGEVEAINSMLKFFGGSAGKLDRDKLSIIKLMFYDLIGLNNEGYHKVYEYLQDMREMPKYRKKANELIQEENVTSAEPEPSSTPEPASDSAVEKPSIIEAIKRDAAERKRRSEEHQ